MNDCFCFSNDQATDAPDPWTASGYSHWQKNAAQIRRQWMAIMGFSAEEIEEAIEHSPPIDIDEEMAQYNAAVRLEG